MSAIEDAMRIYPERLAQRIALLDWPQIEEALSARGCAQIDSLLERAACEALADLYSQTDIFRNRVVMERHGFGRGEYKYFRCKLPSSSRCRRAISPAANSC